MNFLTEQEIRLLEGILAKAKKVAQHTTTPKAKQQGRAERKFLRAQELSKTLGNNFIDYITF